MNDSLPISDEVLVALVRQGDFASYEVLMRRYNRRVFRAVRAILRDDAEAEDAMQNAYLQAWRHLHQFEGRAAFPVWLTRIAIREALGRLRKRRESPVEDTFQVPSAGRDPEQRAADHETARVLEAAIDTLPDDFREVFVLRAVEELSTAETAACLDISEETVKTRLHRSRKLLRAELLHRFESATAEVFPFPATRCDRVVEAVLQQIRESA